MPDDLLRMLEEMHETWCDSDDDRACVEIEGAMTRNIHALLDVLRAADAMRNSVYGGAYLRSLQLEYDAARARFAQAIKEGKS